jgi:putative hydrolase of the HAD superfamily
VTNASDHIQALLFDLGGVLIEIDFERVFRHWARHSRLTAAAIRERFEVDTAFQRHERGEIDGAAYFDHLRRLLLLEGSDAEIAAGWNAVFVGPIEPTLALIRRVRERLPCFCFTNTNPTHQASWSQAFPELGSLFEEIFVSSELGMRKPEPLAFETVAAGMGIPPARILFFDDLAQNVEGARSAGMRAVLVRSPEDVREGLVRSRHHG